MDLNRVIGAFPVSIGTSIALETLFKGPLPPYDPDRKLPPKVDLNNYEVVLINIHTLFRNILSSQRDLIKQPSLVISQLLVDEINIINQVFQDNGQNKPIYFNNDYTFIEGHYKLKPRVFKNKEIEHLFYLKVLKNIDPEGYYSFKGNIRSTHSNALILTHHPWDLISYTNYKKLDLLESHTGVLKTRKVWWTKYKKTGNQDMSFLPFNKTLLGIFGDNYDTLGDTITVRKSVLLLGSTKNWNNLTTEDRVKFHLKHTTP